MRRELREEAGVEVEVGRLVTTVPDFYGDTGEATVNAFYECRVLSGDPHPDDDVAELRWFERDALPLPRSSRSTASAARSRRGSAARGQLPGRERRDEHEPAQREAGRRSPWPAAVAA